MRLVRSGREVSQCRGHLIVHREGPGAKSLEKVQTTGRRVMNCAAAKIQQTRTIFLTTYTTQPIHLRIESPLIIQAILSIPTTQSYHESIILRRYQSLFGLHVFLLFDSSLILFFSALPPSLASFQLAVF
jgi:hypothetical protein